MNGGSNGHAKPSSLSYSPSGPESPILQRIILITTTSLVIYALAIQSSLFPLLPHSWRWDVRPYSPHGNTNNGADETLPAYMIPASMTSITGTNNWTSLPHTIYRSEEVRLQREGPLSGKNSPIAADAESDSSGLETKLGFFNNWSPPQIEVVISYYDEPLEAVAEIIQKAYAAQPHWTHTSTLYHKGMGYDALDEKKRITVEEAERKMREFMDDPQIAGTVDTGIPTRNEGRDGGTYLKHM